MPQQQFLLPDSTQSLILAWEWELDGKLPRHTQLQAHLDDALLASDLEQQLENGRWVYTLDPHNTLTLSLVQGHLQATYNDQRLKAAQPKAKLDPAETTVNVKVLRVFFLLLGLLRLAEGIGLWLADTTFGQGNLYEWVFTNLFPLPAGEPQLGLVGASLALSFLYISLALWMPLNRLRALLGLLCVYFLDLLAFDWFFQTNSREVDSFLDFLPFLVILFMTIMAVDLERGRR